MQRVEIQVFESDQLLWKGVADAPVEIGRQQEGDASPLELQDQLSTRRMVIAPVSARSIPRQRCGSKWSGPACYVL